MGGRGSGRKPWSNRQTVESCLALNINSILDAELLSSVTVEGTIQWPSKNAYIQFILKPTNDNPYVFHIGTTFSVKSKLMQLDQIILIDPYISDTNARTYWFRCPMAKNGTRCFIRTGNLYLPGNGYEFGCRQCHNLVYSSAKYSHLESKDHIQEAEWTRQQMIGKIAPFIATVSRNTLAL